MKHCNNLAKSPRVDGISFSGSAKNIEMLEMFQHMPNLPPKNVFHELLYQVPQVTVALARELTNRVDATSERLLAITNERHEPDGAS